MSRTFTARDGNRLVASEMGQAGRPGPPPARRRPDAPRLGGDRAPARRGGLARDRPRPARPRRQRVGGKTAPTPFRISPPTPTAVARQHRRASTAAKPVAIGASLGGIASLLALAAAGAAALSTGLVLVDVVPRMDPRGVAHIQGFMRARADEGFASIEEAAEAVAAYLPHRPRPPSLDGLKKNLRHHPDGRWRWHWDPRFLDGPRSVNADWERGRDSASCGRARDLAVPTLLVRGGSSELVTPEAAEEFLSLAPAAEYVDVAEARHMVAGDRNDVFADAILPSCSDTSRLRPRMRDAPTVRARNHG